MILRACKLEHARRNQAYQAERGVSIKTADGENPIQVLSSIRWHVCRGVRIDGDCSSSSSLRYRDHPLLSTLTKLLPRQCSDYAAKCRGSLRNPLVGHRSSYSADKRNLPIYTEPIWTPTSLDRLRHGVVLPSSTTPNHVLICRRRMAEGLWLR